MEAKIKSAKLLKIETIEKHQLHIELPTAASVLMDVTVSDQDGIIDIDPSTPSIYKTLNAAEIIAIDAVIEKHFNETT